MGFIKTIRLGVKYMEIWSDDPLLNPIFAECRAKRAMKVCRYVLPPFIFLILVWSFVLGGGLKGVELMFALKSNWPVTIACILFLLFMPLQGYYWFGKRARTPLNEKQKRFYLETCIELGRSGNSKANPNMYDLAQVIRDGIKKNGREFLRKL